ncbi:MAG: GNAT family N-acetyltransferase, partial [Mesorhizobium sp.]
MHRTVPIAIAGNVMTSTTSPSSEKIQPQL